MKFHLPDKFSAFIFIHAMLIYTCVFAQEKNNRYDFAQSYIGFSSQIIPGWGTTDVLFDSVLTKQNLPTTYQPRLDIGGLHFWGHLDMMASIPLFGGYRINYSNVDYHISTGFSMNIRYYPINLLKPTRFGLRPFAGIKWSDMRYWQKVEGSERGIELNKQIVMAETGCAVEHKKYLIDLTLQWMPFNDFSYPLSRTMQGNLKFPPLSFKVGVKYLFDITAVNKKPEIINETDAYLRFLTEKKKLNSWSVGIGISELLPVGFSSYKNIPERKFLQNPGPMHLFPEIGFTGYFFRPDLELRLAYRPVWNKQEGYGFIHKTFRHSVSVEAYKFLFDYKGFLPFAGFGLGYNHMQLREIDNGNVVIQKNEHKLAPLILLGWDIRPTRAEWMIIRSNIRWTPWLYMEINDKKLQFNDVEINFLQYVIYPGRLAQKKNFNRSNK